MTNFKKTLLVGTALVAVGGFALTTSAPAWAADEVAIDTDDDGTYAATIDTTDPWGANDDHDARVDANATVDVVDTDVIGDGDAKRPAIVAGADAVTLTLNDDADDNAAETVTVDGDIDKGAFDEFNLTIAGNASANDALTVDVNGDIDLGDGTLTIDVGGGGDEDVTVTVSGDITTDAIELDDDVAGSALLKLDGTTAQTVTGTIDGAVAGEGVVVVSNNHAGGVTFVSAIGGTTTIDDIVVNSDGDDQLVVFQSDVETASGLVLGDDNGTDTITATFSGDSLEIASDITGGAAETVNLNFAGGDTITLTGAVATIDATVISGSTTVTTNQNFASTDITVGSGSTLATTANTITGDIANSGTLLLDGGDVTGDVTGAGVIDVDENANVAGDVAGTSANIAATKTLTFTGANEWSVTNTTLVDDGAFATSADAQTISGNFLADEDGDGTITITDGAVTTTITGDIGTSAKEIGDLVIDGDGNDNVVTTTGDLYVDAITIDGDDELHFIGTSAQVVSGTIDGGGAGQGEIFVGDGTDASTVTFNGIIGGTTVDTFDVLEESTAILAEDVTTATDIVVDGTLRVNQGVTVTSAAFAAGAADGVIELTIGATAAGADESATLASAGALELDLLDGTDANSATLKLVKGTGVITDGDEFVIGAGGAVVGDMDDDTGEDVADDFALFDFTLFTGDSAGVTLGGNNDIVAVAEAVDAATVTATTNNAVAVDALLDVTADEYDADDELASVYDNVVGASASEIDELVEATTPTVDAGNMAAAVVVNNSSMNITQTRLAALRDGSTGMAAGNVSEGLNVWGQVFGQTGEQDRRDNIDGYDVDTWGIAAGIDTKNIANDVTLGVAFSYADSEVDSKNANATKTDVDTYQLTVYGDYELDERTWLTGQVAYAHGENDTIRHNVGGVAGLNASGDFDADTWSLRAELGRDYNMDSGMVLTPSMLANYMHYSPDSYTEAGAGGAGLVVDQDDLSLFELGVGVDASWLFQQADGSYLEPEVRVGYRYDFVGDEYATTSRFIGATTSFKTKGYDPAQSSFDIGAALTYYSTDNWELTANYDFEIKEDYDAHAGYLRAAYKF